MINLKNDEEKNSSRFLLQNGGHIGVYKEHISSKLFLQTQKNLHMHKT